MLHEQVRPGEGVQRGAEDTGPDDPLDELGGEGSTDHGCVLEDEAVGVGEAVDTGQDRAADRVGYLGPDRGEPSLAILDRQGAHLHQHLQQFLDEEWIALCSTCEDPRQLPRDLSHSEELAREGFAFLRCEVVQMDHHVIGVGHGRFHLEPRTIEQDEHHRAGRQPPEEILQEVQRRGRGAVEVVQSDEGGPATEGP